MVRGLLIFTFSLFAVSLNAHTGTFNGTVKLSGEHTHEGITVSVTPDPLWGHVDADALEKTEGRRGKYPEVTASGEATTDEKGQFILVVEFSFSAHGIPPEKTVERNGQREKVDYASVIITSRKSGYATGRMRLAVCVDDEQRVGLLDLKEAIRLTGEVVLLRDRTPLAGVTLSLFAWGNSFQQRGHNTWAQLPSPHPLHRELTTDDEGRINFVDEELPPAMYALTPKGAEYAFPATSKLARQLALQHGDNDLGTLLVVPGGSLIFSLEGEDGEIPEAGCALYGGNTGRPVRYANGSYFADGLPEGNYQLRATLNGYWDIRLEVSIVPGEVNDLGLMTMLVFRTVEVVALSDGPVGIERYKVSAVATNAVLPQDYNFRNNHSREPYRPSRDLTAEQNSLERLFTGRWLLTITAEGHLPTEIEVDVPANTPVQVTLAQAGGLKVGVVQLNGNVAYGHEYYAVKCDSALYEELIALSEDELARVNTREPKPGLFVPSGWNDSRAIRNLAAGEYLVVVPAGELGVIVRDKVKVTRGELTDLELKPVAPVLELNVTKDGEPAGGETLYVAGSNQHGSAAGQLTEHVTTDSGKLLLELKNVGMVYVLTTHDKSWVDAAANDWERSRRTTDYASFRGRAEYGKKLEGQLELHDPDAVWLTISLDVPSEVKLPQFTIQQKNIGRPLKGTRLDNGDWMFPKIPLGEYVATLRVPDSERGWNELTKEFIVDEAPAQSFSLKFEISSIKISLSYPKGADAGQLYVRLIPEEKIGDPLAIRNVRQVGGAAEDAVSFLAVEPGRYIVIASLHKNTPGRADLIAAGSATIDTTVSESLTLSLSAKVGTLEVEVLGSPAVGGTEHADNPNFRVQLFDEMNEEVFPAFAASFGVVNHSAKVPGVPAGTYRVVVTGHGILPVQETDVVIDTGQESKITVTPRAAALLKLTVKGIEGETLIRMKAKAVYLDGNGNPVDPNVPGDRAFRLKPANRWDRQPQRDKECEAHLLNLSTEVKKVLITADGLEPIEVAVDVEPGLTIVREVKVVLRND